jgi:hypothetical protein
VHSLRSAVGRLDEGVRALKTGVFGFNELLLEVLRGKDIITGTEYTSMMGALRAYIPSARGGPCRADRKELCGSSILNKGEIRVEGLGREEIYEYPVKAIRELIVNAVTHRDCSIKSPI